MHNILIVDDEPGIRQSLKGVLEDEGYKASVAESGEACIESLRKRPFDVVLLDVWLPGMDGLETLEKVREIENAPEVIMISGHGTIETAVRATKLGAYDFLEKPLSVDKTLILVKNAIDSKRLRQENRDLKKQLTPKSLIVGESIPVKALRQQIQLMAPTNGRVLIYGESGTGKELVARAIHAQSLREEEISRGNFREDLFYRLNVIPFSVPPLRERQEDVPLLARYFLKEFSAAYGRRPREISDDAIETLMRYAWPGNVRELRNVIERIVIMNPTTSRFERKHLPPLVHRDGSRRAVGNEFSTLHQARAAYERDYILKKLDENHGNVSRTAEVLGLERSHLYRKMKTLGIAAKE